MDIELIFRQISHQLLGDFKISAETSHPSTKGELREDALSRFLREKLPGKYGIGSGEVISPLSEESKHFDLIIFDKENCPIWIRSNKNQVYPIEGVYGIIEVKSKLSKAKLEEGLEKVITIREMTPKGSCCQSTPLGLMQYSRPIPFGIIFAYSLGDNSMGSLENNLKVYQKRKSKLYWPNFVVVLNEGVIFQKNRDGKNILNAENFDNSLFLVGIHFKRDSLFEFYSALMHMISSTHLGNINIRRYKNLPKRVGKYFVSHHDRIVRSKDKKVCALNEKFIDRVVKHCKKVGKKSYKEILLSELGQIPRGFSREDLAAKCYHYDPENLPGMHEVQKPFKKDENGRPVATCRMKIPSTFVIINEEVYYIPQCYFTAENITEVEGKTIKDLIG